MIYSNFISDRLQSIYRDAYMELRELSTKNNISKIEFSLHSNSFMETPYAIFEKEVMDKDGILRKRFSEEGISEIVFNDGHILVVSVNGIGAYLDFYGSMNMSDGLNVIGDIYGAVLAIVNNNDLKEIELV